MLCSLGHGTGVFMKSRVWFWAAVVTWPLMALAADKAPSDTNYQARVERVLKQTPLIDGHNDLPWEIRERFKSQLAAVDLKSDTSRLAPPADGAPLMTDILRMRQGLMGGQFWSVWVPVELKGPLAV